MDWAQIYFLGVAAMLLAVHFSGSPTVQKLGLVLLAAYVGSNIAVGLFGFARAPLVLPSLHAVLALVVAVVGIRARSRIAANVFALYALMVGAEVGLFTIRAQGGYRYFATLNGIFAVQLLLVGGSGAWLAVRRWAASGGERPRPHPARGPRVAR
jgi:hypothetical protein